MTSGHISATAGSLGVLMRVQGMRADPKAAQGSWRRVLASFDEHLRAQPGHVAARRRQTG